MSLGFLTNFIPGIGQAKTAFTVAKYWIIAIVITAIFWGIWLFYHNYTTMAENNARHEVEISQLKDGIKTQQDTIDTIKADAIISNNIRDGLLEKVNKYDDHAKSLDNKFDKINKVTGEQRNFAKIAAGKPGLVERIINEGTADFLRCIELASGAPRTKGEKDATKPSQINSTCPELANPGFGLITK